MIVTFSEIMKLVGTMRMRLSPSIAENDFLKSVLRISVVINGVGCFVQFHDQSKALLDNYAKPPLGTLHNPSFLLSPCCRCLTGKQSGRPQFFSPCSDVVDQAEKIDGGLTLGDNIFCSMHLCTGCEIAQTTRIVTSSHREQP